MTSILGSRRLAIIYGQSYLYRRYWFFTSWIIKLLGLQLLPFANTQEIVFIPQGIVMTFYGTVGSLLSIFLSNNII